MVYDVIFFEELHALKVIKGKGEYSAKNLNHNGIFILQRLLSKKLCIKKVTGVWFWKKEVCDITLAGAEVLSKYDQQLGRIKHEVAKHAQDIKATKRIKNFTKYLINSFIEKVAEKYEMSLMSFITMEMVLRSDVFSAFDIGEVSFKDITSYLPIYSKDLQKWRDEQWRSTQTFKSRIPEDATRYYDISGFISDLLFWDMLLSNYLPYQEGMYEETVLVDDLISDEDYNNSQGEVATGLTEKIEVAEIQEINENQVEQNIAEDTEKCVPTSVAESTSSNDSSSFDSSSSYDSGSSDSGSFD